MHRTLGEWGRRREEEWGEPHKRVWYEGRMAEKARKVKERGKHCENRNDRT